MGNFVYRLKLEDGTPADPATFRTTVPTWRRGATIPLGGRTLRVVASETTTQTRRRCWSSRTVRAATSDRRCLAEILEGAGGATSGPHSARRLAQTDSGPNRCLNAGVPQRRRP
jgi:hypothetical protein